MKIGHNERSFRLETIAQEAKAGLNRVEVMEGEVIEGWIDYGRALNEGRAMFKSDEQFGKWMSENGLHQLGGHAVHDLERAAAMWAAANAGQLAEAREASNARTLRGLHAKWKEIEAEREAESLRAEQEAEKATQVAEQPPATSDEPEQKTDTVKPWGAADDQTEDHTEDAPAAQAPEKAKADEAPAQEPTPDPYGYSKLTDEALLELANGLREEVDELRAKVKALQGEIEVWKDRHAEATQGDMGATVSNLQKRVAAANYKRDEAMAATKRMEYRMKQAQKRVQELESAVIPL